MARFIRNQILIIRDRDYNVASRCIGTPTSRIVVRKQPAAVSVSVIMLRMALAIPAAIGSEVFITYIGLGPFRQTPLAGQPDQRRPHADDAGRALRYQLLYPTIILSFVTIAILSIVGNAFSGRRRPEEPSAVRRDRRWKKTKTDHFGQI